MKNLFKFIVLITFVLTLSACGRTGDLIPNEVSQVDSGESTSSTY